MHLSLLFAQANNIEIINSNELILEKKRKGEVRKLIGEVVLKHDSVIMECDSAYHFVDEELIEAFSNIKITSSEDSVVILADRLKYNSNTRIFELYDHIILSQDKDSLFTDRLTYYRDEAIGKYEEGGRLINEENTLTSKIGYYYSDLKLAKFFYQVDLINEDYNLKCDSLHYDTKQKKTTFISPTHITTDEKQDLYTNKGYYLSEQKEMFLYDNSWMEDSSYTMKADTLFFNDSTSLGWANCNFNLWKKDSSFALFGEHAFFERDSNKTIVYDHPYAIYFLENDTLTLFADTMISINQRNKKYLIGDRNIKMYMNEIQGIGDSLIYYRSDSMMILMKDPVLWSEASQLTGDTIWMFIRNEMIDSLEVHHHAFSITEEDTLYYNQLKGKRISAKFDQNEIQFMYTRGNAESIYFMKENNKISGMNQSKSTRLKVQFEDQNPIKIWFFEHPEATYYPLHEIWKKENKLPDFKWRIDEKPKKYYGEFLE